MSKDREYYVQNDTCYVLDRNGKIKYSEVIKVLTELKECDVAYQLRDLIDYRYFVAAHESCWDTEAEAKSAKSARAGKDKLGEKIKRKSRKTSKKRKK